MKLFSILIIFTGLPSQFWASSECDGSQPIEVTIKQGRLRGTSMKTRNSKHFCTFLGVPYAEPPVGDLRFKPPKPIKAWKGMKNATRDGQFCIQPVPLIMTVHGSEDCLHLNVFTSKLNGSLLDVVVWFYPGQFYFGTSNSKFFHPHSLMDKDVVLVVPNFRTGAFGFLSTGDDMAPGNYGMKDQVLVLQWIQDNIEVFGGNRNSVTLFGESSGAASVHYHILSPVTKGLFHRGISMGGTALMPWARNDDPLHLAKRQASLVGCPTEPSSELVSCLRKLPPEIICDSERNLFIFWAIPSPGYSPVVERKTEKNPNPYITEDPITIMLNGSFQKIPWLLGSNSQSMGIILVPLFNLAIAVHLGEKHIAETLPRLLLMQKSVKEDEMSSITDQITKFYGVDSKKFRKKEEFSWINLVSDRYIIHGNHRSAILHSLAGHHPIYMYNFAYRGLQSLTQLTTLKNYGVSHADELSYFFGNNIIPTRNDFEVKELLLTLWTNFIKYGNPTPPRTENTSDSSGLLDFLKWKPIERVSEDNIHLRYLNIGQVITNPGQDLYFNENLGPVKLNMAKDLYKDRMKFWDSLPLLENTLCSNCDVAVGISGTSHDSNLISCLSLLGLQYFVKYLLLCY